MNSIKVCEYSRSRSFHDDLILQDSRSRSFHDDLILQDQASGERSQDQWSSGFTLLYPRHLCRRVYSFRFSVRPFICSFVSSFLRS